MPYSNPSDRLVFGYVAAMSIRPPSASSTSDWCIPNSLPAPPARGPCVVWSVVHPDAERSEFPPGGVEWTLTAPLDAIAETSDAASPDFMEKIRAA